MSKPKVYLRKVNESTIRIVAGTGPDAEKCHKQLYSALTFSDPSAAFQTRYKLGLWDGQIHLYDVGNQIIDYGLAPMVISLLTKNGFSVLLSYFDKPPSFSDAVAEGQYQYEPYDYQRKALSVCANQHRQIIISPTGSGKSFIMYMLTERLLQMKTVNKVLLMTPDVSLRGQTVEVFNGHNNKFTVGSSTDDVIDVECTVINVQALRSKDAVWFEQFDAVIADEAHLFAAKTFVEAVRACTKAKYKYAFTGTLAESKINGLVLKGLFGENTRTCHTHELIAQGVLSNFEVRPVFIKHKATDCVQFPLEYSDEIKFIENMQRRNAFIAKIAATTPGNTLVLFRRIVHGKSIVNHLKALCDKNVVYVAGETTVESRNDIRNSISNENETVIVASFKTFGTGIDIPALDTVIFATPIKGKIMSLQSIGRVLRQGGTRKCAQLIDIVDDFRRTTTGSYKNYALKHWAIRKKLYKKEQFKLLKPIAYHGENL